MDPKALLSGRFVFEAHLKAQGDVSRFVAIETDTGRRVVVGAIGASSFANLDRLRGLSHGHLAGILEFSRVPDRATLPETFALADGAGIAVAELVPGRTLHQYLGGKPMNPVKAVAWMLRLIEATRALHTRGAVHGAISPFSIVAEPEGRAIAPVLSQLVVSAVGPYCSPERLKGAAPAPSDDVWALYATLYTALTGRLAFEATARDSLWKAMLASRPKPLAAFGIHEPVLSEIVERGLIGERRLRATDLAELTAQLDRWERDPSAMPPKRMPPPRSAGLGFADMIAGTAPHDAEIIVDPRALPQETGAAPIGSSPRAVHLPPPDPALITSAESNTLGALAREVPQPPAARLVPPAPNLSRRLSFNPFERKRKVWPLVLCAAVAGGGGVYLAVGTESPKVAPADVPASPPPTAPVVKVAKPRVDPAVERDACIRSHFTEGALEREESLAFVCEDGDFRELARTLFARADGSAMDSDPATRRSVTRSELGWYELPATSIIRRSCCAAPAPVILPETPGWCEQLQSAVRRIADDSAKSGDLAPAARSFDKAVGCLFANNISRPYLYERQPNAQNRAAFQRFLSRAAISQARR